VIAVVDTGGANLASIRNALARSGKDSTVTLDRGVIADSSHVILPGVGAAGESMERIRGAGLVDFLTGLSQPVLGICLGMQLLFERSAEDSVSCLGVLPGEVELLRPDADHPVPHMGWNQVVPEGDEQPLFEEISLPRHFYFVHSYAVPEGPWVTARTWHGRDIPACVRRDNFYGVQFHPERSADDGAQVLRNFLAL